MLITLSVGEFHKQQLNSSLLRHKTLLLATKPILLERRNFRFVSVGAPHVLHNMSPSPSTTSLSHPSASPRQLAVSGCVDFCNIWLFHFGRREKTAPRVLVEFLPSCYVRHTHTMAAAVFHSGGLNCREEYLSIKHCLTCGRSVPSKHIAQTSMRRQEGKVWISSRIWNIFIKDYFSTTLEVLWNVEKIPVYWSTYSV